ncbi:PREDICTED: phospholipase A1-like [Acromyrmex echinatior]|uniref:phospholipase A1-like n=1 Tax=Acromyrmex echinatior TaxID=103372 RepID=UPI000580B72B|nr:PREDICTED: phospholipase A1-like [Acromyrmex echinatior]
MAKRYAIAMRAHQIWILDWDECILYYAFATDLSWYAVIVVEICKQYAVFSLDWSDAACYNDPAVLNLLEYPFAVRNTREVGNYLASVPFKNIALIGHSLGAHISSFAAKNLQTSGYGKVPLLIGSDPAGPLFMLKGPEDRFSDTDAERVIALHTSALGLQKSLGHLDLWFNNGLSQPACGGKCRKNNS